MTQKLDSNIEVQRQELGGVVGKDPSEVEILGFATMYTAGDVLVPRDWLLDRCNDLGIPQYVWPKEPWPSSAYKRAMGALIEDTTGSGTERWEIVAPRLNEPDVKEPHKIDVQLKQGDDKIRHLYASVFFEEDECFEEGGKWDQHHLGYFDYDADSQQPIARRDDGLDEDDLLFEIWDEKKDAAFALFDTMKTHHIGHDIRQMMYYATRDYTETVIPLRDAGSVYLFPAGMGDFLEAMSTLYEEINQRFKEGGARMAVNTIPVLDTEDQRKWVESRVEQVLDTTIDKALEEAWEDMDEGATAQEIIDDLQDDLTAGGSKADVYNELLEARLSIEETLQEKAKNLNDDRKQEILDEVLDGM